MASTAHPITIAVDCGGTHIKIALLQDGAVLASAVIDNTNRASDMDAILAQSAALLESRGVEKKDVLGMGLSLPGIVDHRNGKLVSINGKYEWGMGFDFGAWAKNNFSGLPVVVENDARLALLGEVSYGAARGFKNAVLFMLGTGIGTSAVIEGMLLRGVHNQAGILGGHLGCDIHGFACNCGNLGCVEGQVGSWRLPDFLKARDGFAQSSLKDAALLDYRTLLEAYRAGDAFAVSALENIALLWGAGVVNLVHAYDPRVVVFSGGIMRSADILVPMIAQYVSKHAWTPWGELMFVTAEDVSSSALLGVEALLKEFVGVSL